MTRKQLFVVLMGLGLCPMARSQGHPASVAASKMAIAEGFQVQLVASEPMVRQPVAIEFDDRGRLWVIQYLQYPNPAGLKRVQVDRYSRTIYDRVPDPPPRGPKGADRITILEDFGPDGRARRSRDFLTGLNLATGLAFGHGGVFVLQVPYLLFYPDRNRDDVPDGDPDVLVSGFGMEDAHSVANSLTWGPDGWLYGCQGSTVTSNIRGIEFQQGVWRYHPLTRAFELFCEGGGNSWGLDFDAEGHLLYSTNHGGFTMLHGVQGGYYWKQFGKHGALHNPFAFGYFDHVPHRNFKGGHVTAGCTIYQGDSFPDRFRGKSFGVDLLGHGVYWHDLTRDGSSFCSAHGGEMLVAQDTWFAPCDLTTGPDGSLYVADWHDRRTAHPDPDAEWDRSNGRIYRIAAKGSKPIAPLDIAQLSGERLVGLLTHRNEVLARKARERLAHRRDPEVVFPLRRLVLESRDGAQALRALWALYVSGGFTDDFAERCLRHDHAAVRRWTVRLLGDDGQIPPRLAQQMLDLADAEPDVTVRSQLASTAKRLPAAMGLPLARRLLERNLDYRDPHLPLLLWWAVEAHAASAREMVLRLFAVPEAWRMPFLREVILERLMRRYAAEGSEVGYLACAQMLASAPTSQRHRLLTALEQGLQERPRGDGKSLGTLYLQHAVVERPAATRPTREPVLPLALVQEFRRDWNPWTTNGTLLKLAIRLGLSEAQDRVLALAVDGQSPAPLRQQMIQILGDAGTASCVAPLLALLRSNPPEALQLDLVSVFARFESEEIAKVLLDLLSRMSPRMRTRAMEALLGRKSWALAFLQSVDSGRPAAKEVPVDLLRGVALHKDRVLDDLVRKHWGNIQPGTPEEKLAEMRRLNNDLRASAGNATAGRELYRKHCATCHKLYQEGESIGPELTHANRKDREFLLASLVDPSAVIRKEYLAYNLQTAGGRVLTGLLVEQTPAEVTLVNAKNERTKVPRDRIDSLQESPVSLMPEDLLKTLKPQELRDLFAYLQGDKPLP